MKRKSLAEIPCSIARALDAIGEWWTPLVLRDVFYGLRRFEEIATDLPIARNVLADRLRKLVDEGLLEKHEYATTPSRHEYRLTEKGSATFGVLMALMAWGDQWAGGGEAHPPVTLLCRSCESEATAQVCCSSCGHPLTPERVGVRPNQGQRTPRATLQLLRP